MISVSSIGPTRRAVLVAVTDLLALLVCLGAVATALTVLGPWIAPGPVVIGLGVVLSVPSLVFIPIAVRVIPDAGAFRLTLSELRGLEAIRAEARELSALTGIPADVTSNGGMGGRRRRTIEVISLRWRKRTVLTPTRAYLDLAANDRVDPLVGRAVLLHALGHLRRDPLRAMALVPTVAIAHLAILGTLATLAQSADARTAFGADPSRWLALLLPAVVGLACWGAARVTEWDTVAFVREHAGAAGIASLVAGDHPGLDAALLVIAPTPTSPGARRRYRARLEEATQVAAAIHDRRLEEALAARTFELAVLAVEGGRAVIPEALIDILRPASRVIGWWWSGPNSRHASVDRAVSALRR